jgi:hypothetical protein
MTLLSLRQGLTRLLAAGLLLGSAVAVPACDSDNSGDLRFRMRVPEANRVLEGRAAFFSTQGDSLFTADLRVTEQSGLREGLLLARGEGGLPGEGKACAFVLPEGRAFPADGCFAGALQLSFGGDVPTLYYAERGGRLTITERSEKRVSGTFRFPAVRVEAGGTGDAPLSVRVIGHFSAEPGPTDNFPFTGTP